MVTKWLLHLCVPVHITRRKEEGTKDLKFVPFKKLSGRPLPTPQQFLPQSHTSCKGFWEGCFFRHPKQNWGSMSKEERDDGYWMNKENCAMGFFMMLYVLKQVKELLPSIKQSRCLIDSS